MGTDLYKKSGRVITINELIVVAAIVMTVGAVGFILLQDALAGSKDARVAADMHQVIRALELYYHDHDAAYPSHGDIACPSPISFAVEGVCLGGVTNRLFELGYLSRKPQHFTDERTITHYIYHASANQKAYTVLVQFTTDAWDGWCRYNGGTGATVLATDPQYKDMETTECQI